MTIQKFREFILENNNFSSIPIPKREERLISFTRSSFEEFNSFRNEKQVQDQIVKLIEDTLRDPFRGLGKPEQLRGRAKEHGQLTKARWSRRITDKHRLVYEINGSEIKIVACKGHYDDK